MVALIIIYNHRFDKNIAILEAMYAPKFSHVYHLVPFYDGDQPNVIAVYENSYYFQGYIAQGFKQFFDEKFDHYFFVADDMILNPAIDEHNYQAHLQLDAQTSFLPGLKTHRFAVHTPTPISFHKLAHFWTRTKEAYDYTIAKKGVEATRELPTYEAALAKFAQFGFELRPLSLSQIYGHIYHPKATVRAFKNLKYGFKLFWHGLRRLVGRETGELKYPLIGGYADIFVASRQNIRQFCHYCGVFAATDLFVEVALPTAMVLSAQKLVTETDLSMQGRALWTAEELAELDHLNFDLTRLISEFPANYLYLHPVKLSKWKAKT
jgi:hypothetical protein